jgi:hypothetical protein
MSINANKTAYAEQSPVEPSRPAYNFGGNLFHPEKINENLEKVRTPENRWTPAVVPNGTRVKDQFWPDDNPQQNPTNKLVDNENKQNAGYETPLRRERPHQTDLLDDDDKPKFKFSDKKEEAPEAGRPRSFDDFFN